MCGIAGGIWREGVSDHEAGIDAALACLRRRGPDDIGKFRYAYAGGLVELGHTRLSIIDRSTGGHQPMHSADGSLTIVFNGEIYNYRELREELKSSGFLFKSDSDTEVLLAAWQLWNKDCLPKLLGMFAFTVLDRHSNTLSCVRDAFGIKPFFYTIEQDRFLFASEVTALKALKNKNLALDMQRVYDYLVWGDYDSCERTFFDGVNHLLPGHMLTIDLSGLQQPKSEQWWRPEIVENSSIGFSQAVEHTRDLFLRNIRLHLRSDVPLGAALSGGIDSSAVVCAMRYLEPDMPIHTFSYIADDPIVSEERWVDRVNEHAGAIPHKVFMDAGSLADDLDLMIQAQGEPFGSTSIYAQYQVFRAAREAGIVVMLDGQGADEMLAGYKGYPGERIRSLMDMRQPYAAFEFLKNWAAWPGRSRGEGFKRYIGEIVPDWVNGYLRRLNGEDNDPAWVRSGVLADLGVQQRSPLLALGDTTPGRRVVAKLADALCRRGLPALLRHGDRNSMFFSVESRVPFLTLDLVEYLLSLPEHYLISERGETKHVFRAALRGIVPDDVMDRRDKVGFKTPEREWMMSMRDTIRVWLKADIDVPFLDQGKILQEFDLVMSGHKPFTWRIWHWVNFYRWYQHNF